MGNGTLVETSEPSRTIHKVVCWRLIGADQGCKFITFPLRWGLIAFPLNEGLPYRLNSVNENKTKAMHRASQHSGSWGTRMTDLGSPWTSQWVRLSNFWGAVRRATQLLPGSLTLDTYPGNPAAMMWGSPTHTEMLYVDDPGETWGPSFKLLVGFTWMKSDARLDTQTHKGLWERRTFFCLQILEDMSHHGGRGHTGVHQCGSRSKGMGWRKDL